MIRAIECIAEVADLRGFSQRGKTARALNRLPKRKRFAADSISFWDWLDLGIFLLSLQGPTGAALSQCGNHNDSAGDIFIGSVNRFKPAKHVFVNG